KPRGVLPRLAGPAEDGADPGHQLLQAEGLRDVVVPAYGEAPDLVLGGVAGRQEDHRYVQPSVPEPAMDLEAVVVGEHHVEDDEVGLEVRGEAEGVPTG